MTAEFLVVVAGVALSVLFRYVPGFAPWFEAKTKEEKALIQLGLTAAVTVIIFLLSCYSPYLFVTCDSKGVWELLELFGKAFVGNQITHVATSVKRPYKEAAAFTEQLQVSNSLPDDDA